ncbi:MAG TPA: hypothetical protein VI479_22050 [Blastocatellia bacterium]
MRVETRRLFVVYADAAWGNDYRTVYGDAANVGVEAGISKEAVALTASPLLI